MNTYPHDLHRLAATGLKGWERIERDRRQQRNMERLGWAFIVFFAVLTVIALWR